MMSLKKMVSTSKGTENPVKIEMWRTSLINIQDGLKQGDQKQSATFCGVNGKFYSRIPFNASHVIQFYLNKTPMKQIGPGLIDALGKWNDGVMADSGVIHCIPFYYSDKVSLKIDTNVENHGNVTTIDIYLPEEGDAKWCSGATSKIDGCI